MVRSSWAVHEGATIGSLAEAWKGRDGIPAVGIVTEDGGFRGLLVGSHFFAALGRPYGWDILGKKPVTELAEPALTFAADESLLHLSGRLVRLPPAPGPRHFAVTDPAGRFQGTFSEQDLVVTLARATQRDLAVAQTLQAQLVARDWSVDRPGFRARGLCEMFKGVGGDFSALREPSPGQWFGCVCDVSGKGIAASLVTTLLWGLLEETDLTLGLETILGKLNRAVCKAFQGEKFVSGFFWTYREEDGRLRFADLGHSHELFWSAGILRPCTDSPNIPLGIDETLDLVTGELVLAPGDGFLAYSDGVVENIWKPGLDFPLAAVVAGLLENAGGNPDSDLVTPLREALNRFRAEYPTHDDVTLVWFRRT